MSETDSKGAVTGASRFFGSASRPLRRRKTPERRRRVAKSVDTPFCGPGKKNRRRRRPQEETRQKAPAKRVTSNSARSEWDISVDGQRVTLRLLDRVAHDEPCRRCFSPEPLLHHRRRAGSRLLRQAKRRGLGDAAARSGDLPPQQEPNSVSAGSAPAAPSVRMQSLPGARSDRRRGDVDGSSVAARLERRGSSRRWEAVATIHETVVRDFPRAARPWGLDLAAPPVEILRVTSAANLDLLRIVQGSRRFKRGLDGLRRTWRPSSLIHGDLRADNVLLRRRAWTTAAGKTSGCVDWGHCGWADPAWDVRVAHRVAPLPLGAYPSPRSSPGRAVEQSRA